MTDLTIAKTILEQLGGNRFVLMTGAKNMAGSSDSLSFKLPSNPKKVTHVMIKYDEARDLYNMKFMNIRGVNVKYLAEHEGVYFDMLQDLFTQETGFYTKL
jgi:hypothetical protein